jgi:hypothetical protein
MKYVTTAFKRVAVIPFEAAVSVLIMSTGIAQLFSLGIFGLGIIDPLTVLLPQWLVMPTASFAVVTGLLMLLGITTARRRVEMAGLLFFMGVIMDRILLYGFFLDFGSGFIVTGVFYGALFAAACIRFSTTWRSRILVQLKEENVDGNSIATNGN